ALGEPEVPYCKRFAPAVYGSFGVRDSYDFYEGHLDGDPAEVISGGAGSCEYAQEVAGTFALVCEVPYYHDRRIQDMSESGRTRRETIIESLEISRESWRFINDKFSRLKARLPDLSSPLAGAIEDSLRHHFIAIEAEWHWALTDHSLLRPATKAEAFDSLILTRFQDLLTVGMLWRLTREALGTIQDIQARNILGEIERQLDSKISTESAWLEDTLDYETVPIRDLVRLQLGSGLILARYLGSKTRAPYTYERRPVA
ncbi:MAG TPA: hypothetical protein GX506_02310, partial [Firmicutes bacterium]|nr:hypothetical protein [Bacillota bacterium]